MNETSNISAKTSKKSFLVISTSLFIILLIGIAVLAMLVRSNENENSEKSSTISDSGEENEKFISNVIESSIGTGKSYRIDSYTSSAKLLIKHDSKNKLFYSKTTLGSEDFETYTDENGVLYSFLEGDWYKSNVGKETMASLNIATSLTSRIIKKMSLESTEKCPSNYSGTCYKYSFEIKEDDIKGQLYISKSESLLTNINYTKFYDDGTKVETLMTYSYDDFKVELPEGAKNAKDIQEYYDKTTSGLN